jgi:bifunctional UDP-N-acetylglucosamine pyrophosphorylase/glucosamine-1-phosphate N-acetyltransferase
MGDLTKETPKPMLRVQGKPLLEHHLDFLPDAIDEVIFVIGYLGEQIRDYFGDEWNGRTIRYIEQQELNGTAGAIHQVKELLCGKFLVTMGDDLYSKKDLERLIEYPVAILGKYFDDAAAFGIMTKDEHDNLLAVVERPHGFASGLINTAAYALTPDFFDYDPVQFSEMEYGLPQTLAVMAKDIPVKVVEASEWCPVGKPEDIAVAERFLEQAL